MSSEVAALLRDQCGVVSRRQLHGVVVELDGRLFHDTTEQRDRDFDRDLVAAVHGKDSVRLTYGQVFQRPCWTPATSAYSCSGTGGTARLARVRRGVRRF